MNFYAVTHKDGTVSGMQTAGGADAAAIISKWSADARASVADVQPIDDQAYSALCQAKRQRQVRPVAPASTAGAVVAQDPRVDALGPMLSDQIASAFEAMRRELQTEIAVEHRRSIEALTVASALQEGKAIDPGSFPALERILRDAGRPVTSDEIIAAADEQARRSIELAGGL